MIDFSMPFNVGLDAARQAQARREEVKSIFAAFNKGLNKVSDGAAEIVIVPFAETLNAIARAVSLFQDGSKPQLVLAVRNPKYANYLPKLIARWTQNEGGFPCSIIWGDRHVSCDDAESLIGELSALFSSPTVGEAIEAAISFVPSPPERGLLG